MIHAIIWTGKGFLVAVFTFGFSLIANLITNYMTGSGAYWDAHKWPFAASLLFSAVACWAIGKDVEKKDARLLIDPKTGEEVILKESHTLFFVPMTWWGPILAMMSLIVLATERLK